MADLRKIVTEEDPQLHQPSVEVLRFGESLHRLLEDMRETLYQENGVGLAAPQIGINKQIVVVDDRENGFFELVNPKVVEHSGRAEGVEYCLSVPGRGGLVARFTHVKIQAQDRFGKPVAIEADGFLARIFQHEIDHLDGILFTDVMLEEIVDETDSTGQQVRRVRGKRRK